jgi:hypothetical protein
MMLHDAKKRELEFSERFVQAGTQPKQQFGTLRID